MAIHQTGGPVYRVGTKQVHDRAESYDGVPSLHDGKAAHPSTPLRAGIIAELHREGHSALWQKTPAEQRELRGVTAELEVQQELHRANPSTPLRAGLKGLGTVSVLSTTNLRLRP